MDPVISARGSCARSARPARSTVSTSRSPPDRSRCCSAPTARARPPWCDCSPARSHPIRARSRCSASRRAGPTAPRCAGAAGWCPARPALYDRLDGYDNLRYAGELFAVDAAVLPARIEEAATRFGIADALDKRVGGYSTGMRARLALAASGPPRARPAPPRRAHRGPRPRVGPHGPRSDRRAGRAGQGRRDVHPPPARGRGPGRQGGRARPRRDPGLRIPRGAHRGVLARDPGRARSRGAHVARRGGRPPLRAAGTRATASRPSTSRPSTRSPTSSTRWSAPAPASRGSSRRRRRSSSSTSRSGDDREPHPHPVARVDHRPHRPAPAAPGPRLLDAVGDHREPVLRGDPRLLAADPHPGEQRGARAAARATWWARSPPRSRSTCTATPDRCRPATRSRSTSSHRSRSSSP